MLKKAIFLDRDGTINEDPGYLSEPSQMKLFSDVGAALAQLRMAGYLLVVISNQSGVGRGLFEASVLPKIHDRLDELLKPWGAGIDHYGLCLHSPDDACECRKPKPKLVFEAALKLGIDLACSYMVGDKRSDLLAGRAARCKGAVLVRTGWGKEAESQLMAGEADFCADSLMEAATWILNQESVGS